MCIQCALRYRWLSARVRLASVRSGGARRLLNKKLEDMAEQTKDVTSQNGAKPEAKKPPTLIVLIRHGQTTYNVEGRLPGQLPGIPLTEEGRRQAHQAAVALALVPFTTVLSSPLERALNTAEIIAGGHHLAVRQDARLMDTDVGRWSGQKIEDVAKNDPSWKHYVAHPTEPPDGIENLADVQKRAVAAVDEALADPAAGNYIAVVAHADVVKLVLGHYLSMHIKTSLNTHIANASLSALAFDGERDGPPHLLTLNWTPTPSWLVPPLPKKESETAAGPAAASATPKETSNSSSDAPVGAEHAI